MEYGDDDMSWLTQEPSLDSQMDNSNVVQHYIEEDIPLDLSENVVSLEEGSPKCHVLYGDVIAEDILSDECADQM